MLRANFTEGYGGAAEEMVCGTRYKPAAFLQNKAEDAWGIDYKSTYYTQIKTFRLA